MAQGRAGGAQWEREARSIAGTLRGVGGEQQTRVARRGARGDARPWARPWRACAQAGSVGPVRVFGAPGSVLTQFLTQF